jgi:hypothetical protein
MHFESPRAWTSPCRKEALMKETGVPSIVFDLDGVDDREYDKAAAEASLDSFVETLIAGKGA